MRRRRHTVERDPHADQIEGGLGMRDHRGAGRGVAERLGESRADDVRRGRKRGEMCAGHAGIRIVGARQVGEDALHHDPRGIDRGHQAGQARRIDPQARHPGVHLDVDARPVRGVDRGGRIQRGLILDGDRTAGPHQVWQPLAGDRAEHQDRGPEARSAQIERFVGRRHAEPLRAGAGRRLRDGYGAVPVGICLDDGHEGLAAWQRGPQRADRALRRPSPRRATPRRRRSPPARRVRRRARRHLP
ncbi:MAG: hypothetical protein A2Z07_09670 [Armatimonadetes bacterium RBG_16_67_12]|nr:MAG: hypothetical protein A2Z07_09670 [Armatimonadetes bacterium RBG_16_67_12]